MNAVDQKTDPADRLSNMIVPELLYEQGSQLADFSPFL